MNRIIFMTMALAMLLFSGNHSAAQQREADTNAHANTSVLLVLVSWSTQGADVDLYVVDPRGNEYSYQATSFEGSPARLEEDSVNGPGNEVWQHPAASPGVYAVFAHLFDSPTAEVQVDGFVMHSGGRSALPELILSSDEKVLIATITVDDEGNVNVH